MGKQRREPQPNVSLGAPARTFASPYPQHLPVLLALKDSTSTGVDTASIRLTLGFSPQKGRRVNDYGHAACNGASAKLWIRAHLHCA
jgi:hypothetical protein